MLEGWYCRSIAHAAAAAEEEERAQEESKFKKEYKLLKRKLQNLIYENESLKVSLRTAQKRLLTVTRDRSFLLDRLLMHEKVDQSTSESDNTDSSDDAESIKIESSKRRRLEQGHQSSYQSSTKGMPPVKKKRPSLSKPPRHHNNQQMMVLP